MAIGDSYYDDLIQGAAGGPGAPYAAGAGAAAKASGSKIGKMKSLLSGKTVKTLGPELLLWMLAQKGLDFANKYEEGNIVKAGMQSQRELATPENLYTQAALPTAQAEADQARQALFSQLSGGVLGPTLARGERLI